MSVKVDLSLAKPGDLCWRRDGYSVPFVRREVRTWKGLDYVFVAGGDYYTREGRYDTQTTRDIIGVTRDGVQIVTPAVDKASDSTAADNFHVKGCLKQPPGGAVIIELVHPGKYRTNGWDETGEDDNWLVEIIGRHGKNWLGYIRGYFAYWADDGRLSHFCHSNDSFPNRDHRDNACDLTGPHVEPTLGELRADLLKAIDLAGGGYTHKGRVIVERVVRCIPRLAKA
jgi:hypothetical protein